MECCDVFSGIGGITYALRGIVQTVIYCEIEKYCQQDLSSRMNDGSLDKAPIHGDLKTLHLGSLNPSIISGGFPCQNISTAGLQKGISDGDKSCLFYEIMRLVDENPSINYIFLENVSNIVKVGMREVVDEIAIKRGWTMQWTMKSAAMLGSCHQRRRWFCLAVRPGAPIPIIDVGESEPNENPWAIEHPLRVSFKPNTLPDNESDPTYDPNWISRCQALGNSVVPCVVRAAFIELWNAANDVPIIVKSLGAYCQDVSELDYPYPESGIIFKGNFLGLEGKRSRTNTSISVCVNGSIMSSLPTPRRGITHASTVTDRSLHDLPTVLLNSTVAVDYIRERLGSVPEKLMSVCIPNVNYIEWMMGYRPDWTMIHVDAVVVAVATSVVSVSASAKKRVGDKDNDIACKKSRINGMHIFMRENPGKDVRTIAAMWRGLTDESRAAYTRLAKNEH